MNVAKLILANRVRSAPLLECEGGVIVIVDHAQTLAGRDVTAPGPFDSASAFRRHARNVLHREPPVLETCTETILKSPGDFDLNPPSAEELALVRPDRLRPAAVLIPVIARTPLSVLLTVRSDRLPSHAGQISFPGGKLEADDAGPAAAAMREAREEVGLESRFIEPVGYLDWYRTSSGYVISPLVALVHPGYDLRPDPGEVAEIFEVPLHFLLDAGNHRRHSHIWRGRQRHFHAVPYEERYIWGITAGIIKNLHERLTGS